MARKNAKTVRVKDQTDARTDALVAKDAATATYRAERDRAAAQGKPTLRDTLRAAQGKATTRKNVTPDAIPTHGEDGKPLTVAQRLRLAQGKTLRGARELTPEENARRVDMKTARRVMREYRRNEEIANNTAFPADLRAAAQRKCDNMREAFNVAHAFHAENLKRK